MRLTVPFRYLAPVALSLLVVVPACQTATPPEDPVPTTITITTASVDLSFIGQTSPLGVNVLDQNGAAMSGLTLAWSSSDDGVATVTQGGVVAAVSNGTATITVQVDGISATATANVAQVATAVAITAGLNQEATAGTELADPIVARAQDAGGTAVEGVTISFTPDTDNGSVSVTSADSDANGEVTTVWTLGAGFGPQRLVADITGATAEVTAIARSENPIADLVLTGNITVQRGDPTSLETITVGATVQNDGDLSSQTTFTVRLLSDGVEVATATAGPLASAADELVVFNDVGPLTAGTKVLTVEVDSDDEITELIESNNEDTRNLVVASQTEISVGGNASITLSDDEQRLFKVTVPPGPEQVLDVQLTGVNGDGDIYVHRGDRPSLRTDFQDCAGLTSDSNELCQLVFPEGEYHIAVHAFAAVNGATLSVDFGSSVEPFDIEVVILDGGTQNQEDAFFAAATTWENIIIKDLPDFDYSGNPSAADECFTGKPLITDVIDDVRIFVRISAIDGPGGTLGQAGPCSSRFAPLNPSDPNSPPIPGAFFPIYGQMQFDEADLTQLESNGSMNAVILHEMAHVLGLGTLWNGKGLLQNPSLPNNQGADTHFTGDDAIAAFDAEGGAAFVGSKVPVENQAGPGSGDSHWRETNLTSELMTPFLNSGTQNPLSSITIASFADMGYGVDMTQAESYQGVTLAPPGASIMTLDGMIDLSNDIHDAPVKLYDLKGNFLRILR